MSQLPIEAVLADLLHAVRQQSQIILQAAPGAGKSTHFPLTLIKEGIVSGKIILLEPRRLAAKSIAHYLAKQLGESVGETVGYRMRGDTRVGKHTRLEIVTEGVMTRMLQQDPMLDGVGMLIFDEYHERSIHADLSLALALEIQQALREELKIVVMSATLDAQALQALMPDAAYIHSQGRQFPVEIRHVPLGRNEYLMTALVRHIHSLVRHESGSILVFLPSTAMIKQLAERLDDDLPSVDVRPLYGQLPLLQQQRAIAPAPDGRRKIVLATNMAETSLTIEGVRVVLDTGLERVAKFDLKTGITKLEQVKIAQSSAQQRTGRAGRTEPGVCLRLYSESQYSQQPAVPPPEMLRVDLASLAMELVQWGVADGSELCWLDAPPKKGLEQVKQLLCMLGLLDKQSRFTTQGLQAYQLGLEPRLAAMLVKSSDALLGWYHTALVVAALLEQQNKRSVDFGQLLSLFLDRRHPQQKMVLDRIHRLADKMQQAFEIREVSAHYLPLVLSLAYPDRIAQKRHQQVGKYVLANGHGAEVRIEESLSDEEYLIAVDLMRSSSNASQVHLAVALDMQTLRAERPDLVKKQQVVEWSEQKGRLLAECRECIGQLVLSRTPLKKPSSEQYRQALLSYVRENGLASLNWSVSASALLSRIRCAIEWLPELEWPEMDEGSLLEELPLWLEPYLNGVTNLSQLQAVALEQPLLARIGWELQQTLNEHLPVHYLLPTGNKKSIRYQEGQQPVLSVRMQEVFGERCSPTIARGRKTLQLELLSPAQRPLQVTQDLAGFWQGAYKEVQKEMKGRYPKHVWPDDPAQHQPTSKTKRQLNR